MSMWRAFGKHIFKLILFEQVFQPGLPTVHNSTAALPDLQRRQLLQSRLSHPCSQRLPQVRVSTHPALHTHRDQGPAPAADGPSVDHTTACGVLCEE